MKSLFMKKVLKKWHFGPGAPAARRRTSRSSSRLMYKLITCTPPPLTQGSGSKLL